jgi:hypothetical protein
MKLMFLKTYSSKYINYADLVVYSYDRLFRKEIILVYMYINCLYIYSSKHINNSCVKPNRLA